MSAIVDAMDYSWSGNKKSSWAEYMVTCRIVKHTQPVTPDQTDFKVGVTMGPIIGQMLLIGPMKDLKSPPSDVDPIRTGVQPVKPIHGSPMIVFGLGVGWGSRRIVRWRSTSIGWRSPILIIRGGYIVGLLLLFVLARLVGLIWLGHKSGFTECSSRWVKGSTKNNCMGDWARRNGVRTVSGCLNIFAINQ